jgi:hypothetical protein
VKGLRFERIATGRHYNVVFHIGSTYVPVSDDTIEELKEQSLLPDRRSHHANHRPPRCDQRTVIPFPVVREAYLVNSSRLETSPLFLSEIIRCHSIQLSLQGLQETIRQLNPFWSLSNRAGSRKNFL